MNNLQIGDIITNGTLDFEVVYVSKDKKEVAIKNKNDCLFSNSIERLIANGYTKKETPWVPVVGKEVWFIGDDGKEYQSKWENHPIQRARAAFLGVFPDQASAIKRREEFKAFRKTK